MNAGVSTAPCGVVKTPARAGRNGSVRRVKSKDTRMV
jgi:hypothetical protein